MSRAATTQSDTPPALASTVDGLPMWRAILNRGTAVLRKFEPWGQSAVLLALRLLYGWLFAQTGWGKLMNLERTSGFFENLGLPAPALMARLVGSTELVGGVLLVLGAGTRLTATALSFVMITALWTAHAEEAFANLAALTEQAPYPFLVATILLLVFGAGRLSVDRILVAPAAPRRIKKTKAS